VDKRLGSGHTGRSHAFSIAMAPTDPVTIRAYARESDLDAVVAIVRELQAHEARLYDRMRAPGDMGAWYVEHLEGECRAHGGRILVAEQGGMLVGYATVLTRIDVDCADEVAHSYAYVLDLAVSTPARGQGIARLLLEGCEAEARRCGAGHLRVTVLADNRRARDVYEAFGFRDLFVDLEKPLARKAAGGRQA